MTVLKQFDEVNVIREVSGSHSNRSTNIDL